MKVRSVTLSILLLISGGGLTLTAQDARLRPSQLRYLHHEKADDPYLPNAHNNQVTTPAFRFVNRSKSGGSTTSIVTVQVNINADGRNIVDDAANEPSIAIDPKNPDNMVIGWRQFDNIASDFRQAGWAYTTDAGKSWTFPGVIEPGIFRSDPVLDVDATGTFHYNSLTNYPDYFCKVFRSSNGGAGWDGGTDAAGGDKQWMVIDRTEGPGKGNIYAFWSYYFSTCYPGFFTRSVNQGDSYEACSPLDGNPYWGTLATGTEGELFAAGVSGSADSLVVVRSVTARLKDQPVSWERPVMVYFDGLPTGWDGVNPGGLLGQVSIDVDHSSGPGRGNVYLLASTRRTSNGDPCDVLFAASRDSGRTWSAPVRINDDISSTHYQWFGTMSVAPTGRIDAIWLDTRDAPAGSDSSALYYSYSTDQGITWSANERLSESFDSHVGYPNQNKMGDYVDMVSDSLGAHLAWAATFNGEQDVYYSRIIPQTSSGIAGPGTLPRLEFGPNPATDKLTVQGVAAGTRIEILTILGKTIKGMVSNGPVCEIDLGGLAPGAYLIRLVTREGQSVVRKVFVE